MSKIRQIRFLHFLAFCMNAGFNIARGKTLTCWAVTLTLCLVFSLVSLSAERRSTDTICVTAAANFCLHIVLEGCLHWLFTALGLLERGCWSGPPRTERHIGAWLILETSVLCSTEVFKVPNLALCFHLFRKKKTLKSIKSVLNKSHQSLKLRKQ